MSTDNSAAAAASRGFRLTVLGTSDLHGNVLNWDYFTDAEYRDRAGNHVGVAKIASLVARLRSERAGEPVLLLDAGDTIQGTPLTYRYGSVAAISGDHPHPMAAAMNALGFDAAAVGNHEFNYGLPLLRQYQSQLAFPLLCANARDWDTGEPGFAEFTIKTVTAPDGRPVSVGILGLVTPGCAIWDKGHLDGKLRFEGVVERASELIGRVKAAGADLVIVCCHSGSGSTSSYGDALPWPENAATELAAQVPGIDAVLVGHAHVEIAERFVVNESTGRSVLLSEPLKWGMRLSVMELDVVADGSSGWQVASARASLLDANAAVEDPAVSALVRDQHEQTRAYVNGVIGASVVEMSAAEARYQSATAIDLINYVQARAVRQALASDAAGRAGAGDLPVLAVASPVNPDAGIPSGAVTVRDIAGLYIYDNTLEAIQLDGAALRAYLEFSARYFQELDPSRGSGPFRPDELTNAVTATAPHGMPDYNYDILGGLDAPVSYDIDLARPVGARIRNLTYGAQPIADDQQFALAINNYRAAGGGNFPGVRDAPRLLISQWEIRELIIDWAAEVGTIDPSHIQTGSWRLTSGDQPIEIAAGDGPTERH
ncbi:MAG: nucleotidase [Frankiales bacterium]|nr:nucleotidase [Frankiales bacterium]